MNDNLSQSHSINWIHFGGGNLFRAFHAKIAQDLVANGDLEHGIVVMETFDKELIDEVYYPYENKFLQVILFNQDKIEVNPINTIDSALFCHPEREESFSKAKKYFKESSLQLVTLTITEKAYNLFDSNDNYFRVVNEDIQNGPHNPNHTISILTSLLYERFQNNRDPIAMVSTDNFSKNGDVLKKSINQIAVEWEKKEYVSTEFINYLNDEEKVSFPWTMIDRITPNPSIEIKDFLQNEGYQSKIIQTNMGTMSGTFSNTEAVHYLVVEDKFPNGRPPLENSGVIFSDRLTVDKVDKMKVTTCLNPLHTALAMFGKLFRYDWISDEMLDNDIVNLIKGIGYQEGLPVVEYQSILDPKYFLDQVINVRLPNPMIPDSPSRIATDTSQKLAIRFGETIKRYQISENLSVDSLKFIPFTLAGWIRYLYGEDDSGIDINLSPDPLLDELKEKIDLLYFGISQNEIHELLENLFSNDNIFGVNLYDVHLGFKVEKYVEQMFKNHGAVRDALRNVTK